MIGKDFSSLIPLKIMYGFSLRHKIVFADLIKSFADVEILKTYSDDELESIIRDDLSNVNVFNVAKAFKGKRFEKVFYTRRTWDNSKRPIPRLTRIRNQANEALLDSQIVQSISDIEYRLAPWIKEPFVEKDWQDSLAKFKVN